MHTHDWVQREEWNRLDLEDHLQPTLRWSRVLCYWMGIAFGSFLVATLLLSVPLAVMLTPIEGSLGHYAFIVVLACILVLAVIAVVLYTAVGVAHRRATTIRPTQRSLALNKVTFLVRQLSKSDCARLRKGITKPHSSLTRLGFGAMPSAKGALVELFSGVGESQTLQKFCFSSEAGRFGPSGELARNLTREEERALVWGLQHAPRLRALALCLDAYDIMRPRALGNAIGCIRSLKSLWVYDVQWPELLEALGKGLTNMPRLRTFHVFYRIEEGNTTHNDLMFNEAQWLMDEAFAALSHVRSIRIGAIANSFL